MAQQLDINESAIKKHLNSLLNLIEKHPNGKAPFFVDNINNDLDERAIDCIILSYNAK